MVQLPTLASGLSPYADPEAVTAEIGRARAAKRDPRAWIREACGLQEADEVVEARQVRSRPITVGNPLDIEHRRPINIDASLPATAEGRRRSVKPKYLQSLSARQLCGDSPQSRQRPWTGPAKPKTGLHGLSPRHGRLADSLTPVPMPVIIEAVTSLAISWGSDEEMVQVLPRTWLAMNSMLSVEDAGNRLSPGAGGGHIVEDHSAVFQRVVDKRLHAASAEANFLKSSRGASVVALRHAAHILVLFGNRPRPEEYPGDMALPESEEISLGLPVAQVAERLRRAESLVVFRAAAASQRSAAATGSLMGSPNDSQPLPDGATAGSNTVRQSQLQKGHQALVDFIRFANHKCGNPVRAWFLLDPEATMSIGEKQFARACVDIGFRGNVGALWRYLDSDQSGHITILELDAPSAMLLADFKLIISKRFDGQSKEAFKFLDANHGNRVFKYEFMKGMKQLGFSSSSSARLFGMLDCHALGFLLPEDLSFLDRWSPPPYLFARPDHQGLENLKGALRERHKTLLRAWRRALDKDATMRVSWDEFSDTCNSLLKTRVAGVPETEEESAAVWRALDQDCGGWIALREFDPESFDAVAHLKRWGEQTYGSIVGAFRELGGRNPKLTEADLLKTGIFNEGDPKLQILIAGLNINDNVNVHQKPLPNGTMTKVEIPYLMEGDVRFLDKWDLSWEDREATSMTT